MEPPQVDLEALAQTATESTDPIIPQTEDSPFTPDEAAERDSFLRRALNGPPRERPTRKRRERPSEPRKREPKPTPPKPRTGSLAGPLTQLYVSIGMLLLPFDPTCATAVINSAPKCGAALENLARENPAVRRALLALVETSVWGQLVAAHAPIFLAIAVHHVPAVKEYAGTIAGKMTAEATEEFLRTQSPGDDEAA